MMGRAENLEAIWQQDLVFTMRAVEGRNFTKKAWVQDCRIVFDEKVEIILAKMLRKDAAAFIAKLARGTSPDMGIQGRRRGDFGKKVILRHGNHHNFPSDALGHAFHLLMGHASG
ncbi:MAG: hypothetical protein ACK5WN_14610 [Alphaproteobacteria bacterium]